MAQVIEYTYLQALAPTTFGMTSRRINVNARPAAQAAAPLDPIATALVGVILGCIVGWIAAKSGEHHGS